MLCTPPLLDHPYVDVHPYADALLKTDSITHISSKLRKMLMMDIGHL